MSILFSAFTLLSLTVISQDVTTCNIPKGCGVNCINEFKECIDSCQSDCEITFEGESFHFLFGNSSDIGIVINNKTNIHITGDTLKDILSSPTVFVHGLNTLFTFQNCKNITIDNLIFDLHRNPFTTGIVNTVNYVEKSFTMMLDNLLSYPFPGSMLLNDDENYDFLFNVTQINGYDTVNEQYISPSLNAEGSYIDDVDTINNELTIVVNERSILNYLNHGQTIVLRHESEGYNLMNFEDNEDITLSEVTISTAAGNGLDFVKNNGITLDNIKIKNNKPMSVTNKGVNMELNKGDINIIDSIFNGIGSDGISINNYFFEINATINTSCIQLTQNALDNIIEPWLNIGDIYEFRDRNKLSVYFKSKLIDFYSEFNIACFLDKLSLEKINPCDVITSVTSEPNAVNIISNKFTKSLSIANNIKTSNINVINNIYDKITSSAIVLNCDAGNKLQSGVSKNVLITNNNITRCNYGDDSLNGTITITATTKNIETNEDIPLETGQVHNSIKISDNYFDESYDTGKDKAGLSIRAVRGFCINNNNIILPKLNFPAIQEFNDLIPTIVVHNKCKTVNGQPEKCIIVSSNKRP